MFIVLFAVAAQAQSVSASGTCPGQVDLDVAGFSPGAVVMLMPALSEGDAIIDSGPCLGTVTGLSVAERGPVRKMSSGQGAFWFTAPEASCGLVFQAIDLKTCVLSDVAVLPLPVEDAGDDTGL